MNLRKQSGLTLIELMIGLTIFTLLLLSGAPSFSAWIQSSHIRNSAESIQNGLTFARAEAVRRNKAVSFNLVDSLTSSCTVSTSSANWVISRSDPTSKCDVAPSETSLPRTIDRHAGSEGAANAVVAADQGTITFNSIGRVSNLATASAAFNITNPSGGTCVASGGRIRCLRVEVTSAGQVRMCDPALASTDVRAC